MASGSIALDIIANDRASQTFDKVGSAASGAGGKLESAAESMDGVGSATSQAAGGIGDLGGALAMMPGPLGALGSGMEMAAPAIMGVTGAADLMNLAMTKFPALAKVQVAMTKAMTVAQRALNLVMRMNPIGLVITALLALAVVIPLIVKHWDKIKAVTQKVWGVIKTVVGAGVNFIKNIISNVFGAIRGVFSMYFGFYRTIFSNAFGAIKSIVTGRLGDVVGFVKAIPGKLSALAGMFGNAGRALIGAFINGLRGAANLVSDIAGNIWNAVRGLLNNGIDKLNNALEFKISILGKDVGINPPDIPHLAKGGIVSRPTLALIGEAGPEAVVPLSGPNARRAGVGGGGVFITINGALDPVGVGKQVEQALIRYQVATGRPLRVTTV